MMPGVSEVAAMLDRIAPACDRLNRVRSLRSDVGWRDCVARSLAARRVRTVLDVATGTGDLLLAIDRRLPRLTRAVGVDLAPEMLHVARDKLARAGCAAKLTLGDAHRLPFEEHAFDAVTVAFGIRNMADRPHALGEMHRVLAGGGTLAVLEFSIPESPRLRALYLTCFRHVLPAVGRLVSGDAQACRYLDDSMDSLPSASRFVAMLRQAGFAEVTTRRLIFGTAMLYLARKASADGPGAEPRATIPGRE